MTTEPPGRQLVELRIHGINNTPAASLLECPEPDVVQIEGDRTAGFYRRRTGEGAPGVQREAYSWGGLNRTSGFGSGLPFVAVFERVLWVLLVPFGLANVAYWSRPLDNGTAGRGATGVRLFGLGLTVLVMITLCTVTMDLFALQCHPDAGGICQLDLALSEQPAAWRVAWFSVLPMLVLGLLWLLTRVTRNRYERFATATADAADHGADDAKAGASAEPASRHVLESPQLWKGGAMVQGLSRLHVAAGSAVVVLTSAWPALFGPGAACRTLDELLGPGCAMQAAAVPPLQRGVFGTTVVLAALVLAAATVLVATRTKDGPDVRGKSGAWTGPATTVVFAAALILYVAEVIALHVVRPALTDVGTFVLPGSNGAPAIVVAVLVGIAASGLAWRSAGRGLPEIFGAVIAIGLLAVHLRPLPGAVLVLLGVVGLAVLIRCGPSVETADRPWRRTAPGALLGMSLLAALILSAVVVLAAGDWLDRRASASDLLFCEPAGPTGLCVPRVYVWAATSTLVTVALVGLLVVVLLVLTLRRPMPGDPAAPAVRKARRRAALAHRAEPVVGLLGLLGLVAAAVAVIGAEVPPTRWRLPEGPVAVAAMLADRSAYLFTTAALLAAGAAALRALNGREDRPLGLLWDLVGFLPRAAHPFAPPCYAERAVPELADRVRGHVAGQREVVLSAHSLGAALAVAAYYRLPRDQRGGLRLLTYGTQLRPYFGRLFPDLFGPGVLGSQPCPGAALWSANPWAADTEPAGAAPASTLRGELGPRWVSLWRPTDHLGFPVCAYPANPVDVLVGEQLDGRVQTHGGYLRTQDYSAALHPASRPGAMA